MGLAPREKIGPEQIAMNSDCREGGSRANLNEARQFPLGNQRIHIAALGVERMPFPASMAEACKNDAILRLPPMGQNLRDDDEAAARHDIMARLEILQTGIDLFMNGRWNHMEGPTGRFCKSPKP